MFVMWSCLSTVKARGGSSSFVNVDRKLFFILFQVSTYISLFFLPYSVLIFRFSRGGMMNRQEARLNSRDEQFNLPTSAPLYTVP